MAHPKLSDLLWALAAYAVAVVFLGFLLWTAVQWAVVQIAHTGLRL